MYKTENTENAHKNVMVCMRTHGASKMEQYEKMQSTQQTLLMTLNLNTFLYNNTYTCCIGSQALFNGNVIISFRIVACLPLCARGFHETIS